MTRQKMKKFFRTKKSGNDIIQLAYLRENIWLVSIPVLAEKGSCVQECECQDCVDVICQSWISLVCKLF